MSEYFCGRTLDQQLELEEERERWVHEHGGFEGTALKPYAPGHRFYRAERWRREQYLKVSYYLNRR